MRNAIRSIAKGNPDIEAMMQQDADTIREIADRFDRLMAMANEGRESEGSTAEGNEGYKYQLKPYTEHQKENWKNSKLIHIYESDQQLRAFIDRSLSDPSFRGKMYFGQVDERLAEVILNATGIKTEGMNLTLHSDEVRKIIKNHGQEKEALRGQKAISPADFGKIMQIVQDADMIERSENDYFGNPVIVFSKMIDGKMTAVTYASGKHMDLRVQTMYSAQKNKSLATATDDQASVNTPKATRGTALNSSISDSAEKNNPSGEKFSLRDQTETEAFRRWFGDSQVVNEDGSPKVVYHATDEDFSVFDRGRLGSNTKGNTFEEATIRTAQVGFWFSDRDVSGDGSGRTRAMANEARESGAGTAETGGDTRLSLKEAETGYYDYSKSFSEQVDDWLNG
ncbi:MAG: hypothetical protein ACI4O7_10905, partial [Aristaeellaceae bacterium]